MLEAIYAVVTLKRELRKLRDQLTDAISEGKPRKVRAIEEAIGEVETSIYNCEVEVDPATY